MRVRVYRDDAQQPSTRVPFLVQHGRPIIGLSAVLIVVAFSILAFSEKDIMAFTGAINDIFAERASRGTNTTSEPAAAAAASAANTTAAAAPPPAAAAAVRLLLLASW